MAAGVGGGGGVGGWLASRGKPPSEKGALLVSGCEPRREYWGESVLMGLLVFFFFSGRGIAVHLRQN